MSTENMLSTHGIEEHSQEQFIRLQKKHLEDAHKALSEKDQAFVEKLQGSLSTIIKKVAAFQNAHPQPWVLFQRAVLADDEKAIDTLYSPGVHGNYEKWLSDWRKRWNEVNCRKRFIGRRKEEVLARKNLLEQNPNVLFQEHDDITEEKISDGYIAEIEIPQRDFGEERKLGQILEAIYIDEIELGRYAMRGWQEGIFHLAQMRIQAYTALLEELDREQQQLEELHDLLKPLDDEIKAEMSQLFTSTDSCKLRQVISDERDNLLHLAVREKKLAASRILCIREPMLVYDANQSEKSPLELALTGTDMDIQRIVFKTAIHAIEINKKQIPDNLPLVQQADELIQLICGEINGYAVNFLDKKEDWIKYMNKYPRLGSVLWVISSFFRRNCIESRQEALIELLLCLKETMEEFRLEDFNEKRKALAKEANRGLLRRSNLFDRLENKLKAVVSNHYLMPNIPGERDLVRHEQNKDILIISKDNGSYEIYCVFIKSGKYEVADPIVIDRGELKTILDRINLQGGFSNQRCREDTLVQLVNRIVAENGGYTQAAAMVEHPDFPYQRDLYIDLINAQEDKAQLKKELKQKDEELKQKSEEIKKKDETIDDLKAKIEALERQNSQQNADERRQPSEHSPNSSSRFF